MYFGWQRFLILRFSLPCTKMFLEGRNEAGGFKNLITECHNTWSEGWLARIPARVEPSGLNLRSNKVANTTILKPASYKG